MISISPLGRWGRCLKTLGSQGGRNTVVIENTLLFRFRPEVRAETEA